MNIKFHSKEGRDMTKDELIAKQERIIEELKALILKLMRAGEEEYQKVSDLFCKIEVLPKHTEPEPIVPDIDPKKLIDFGERREQKRPGGRKEKSDIRPCPRCVEHRPRKVYASGNIAPYCAECLINRLKKPEASERRTATGKKNK